MKLTTITTTKAVCLLALTCVTSFVAADIVAVPRKSLWKYQDDGVSLVDTDWKKLSYDDSTWAEGAGELGYGDADEGTVLDFGPNSKNKYPTYYFRHTVAVHMDPSTITAAVVGLLADDGAVIYINGVEVGRKNMPHQDPVPYDVFALTAVGGGNEDSYEYYSFDPSLLVRGENVIAAEVHQADAASSDVSFDAEALFSTEITTPYLVSPPIVTPVDTTGVFVSYVTSALCEGQVYFDGTLGAPLRTNNNRRSVDEDTLFHNVPVGGLAAGRQWSYALTAFSPDLGVVLVLSNNNRFATPAAPSASVSADFRLVVMGDSGADPATAASVVDAYQVFQANEGAFNYPKGLITLGGAAYSSGALDDYKSMVSAMKPLSSKVTTWSVFGTVDDMSADSSAETGDFFDLNKINVLAGGTSGSASSKEAYYSFNMGAVHCIVLDTIGQDRSASGAMATWLTADLTAASSGGNDKFVVAFLHHPVYSAGADNSDTTAASKETRENLIPIMEAFGVDLVVSGHTRAYERSVLFNGFAGSSDTYNAAIHAVDAGAGPYYKSPGMNANQGAVFVNVGSSGGATEAGTLNFPGMAVSAKEAGSLVIDATDSAMDVRFLTNTGAVLDRFVINKVVVDGGAPTPAASPAASTSPAASATSTATPGPSTAPSFAPSPSGSNTPSRTPVPTPSPTKTKSPASTPTATASAAPSPSNTPSISESNTPAPSVSASTTPAPSPSATMTMSAGSSPSESASNSPAPSVSNTPTPTLSESNTPSISESASASTSEIPSATPTPTVSLSQGASPSNTPSVSPTISATPTNSVVTLPSPSPTASMSAGADPPTSTSTALPSVSATRTPDPSMVVLPSASPSTSPVPIDGGDAAGGCTCSCDALSCCGVNIAEDIVALCTGSSPSDDSGFSTASIVATAGSVVGVVLVSGVVLYAINKRRASRGAYTKHKSMRDTPREGQDGDDEDDGVVHPGGIGMTMRSPGAQERSGLLGAGAGASAADARLPQRRRSMDSSSDDGEDDDDEAV